jgi:predicted component of type VI protein secretion system
MEAKLVALAPAEIVNTEFNLQLPVTIGRGRDAKIKLVHGQISRLHCEVYEDRGQLKARDLGSLNGTFVDGERVSDAELKPGGLLNIGSVTFRAVYGVMPSESDDSAVEFGAPRITDTVSTTSTVMEDAFSGFGANEEAAAAADDGLGMFDFAAEPAPAKAAASATPVPVAPKPIPRPAAAEEPTISIAPSAKPAAPVKAPPAAPAAPVFAPPVEPAKAEGDVDDWLNISENDAATPAAEDDDLQSFFGNMK